MRLEVWCSPWAVAWLFGGEAVSAVESLCPRSELVQAVLDRWLAVFATASADVVMWDEPRGRCCDVWPLLPPLFEDARSRGLENAVCLAPDHPWPAADLLRGVTRLGVEVHLADLKVVPGVIVDGHRGARVRITPGEIDVGGEALRLSRACAARHQEEQRDQNRRRWTMGTARVSHASRRAFVRMESVAASDPHPPGT